MKVILKENITNLGKAGDVVIVSDGYARNYLLPSKKVLLATEFNVQHLESTQKAILKKSLQGKQTLEEMAKKLSEFTCTVSKKTGKNDKLFGSVTSQDIHKVLIENGFHVERRSIELSTPIKSLGNYEVSIKLHPEVNAALKVVIKAG